MVHRFVCLGAIAAFALLGLASAGASAAQPAATIRIRENVHLTASGQALVAVDYSCIGSRDFLFTHIVDAVGQPGRTAPVPANCDGSHHTVTLGNVPGCCVGFFTPGRAAATARLFSDAGVTLAQAVRTVKIR